MIALLLALAGPPPVAARQAMLLKDWALSRCIGRAAGGAFRDDAYATAAALLEKIDTDIGMFNRIDALIDQALREQRSGSVPGRYDTLKCLDLYHGEALDRVIARRTR